MLDQDSVWLRFLAVIEKSTENSVFLAKQMKLPLYMVEGYRDQLRGRQTAKEFGNSHMPQHIVGFRYCKLPRWVLTKDIQEARRKYDEGLVEVCQGLAKVRNEPAYILYAVPRKTKRKPKRGYELAYFSKVNE